MWGLYPCSLGYCPSKSRKGLEGVQWKLGDLALTVETVHGGQTLEKFAETVGEDYSRLRHWKAVAETYEFGVVLCTSTQLSSPKQTQESFDT